MKVTLPQGFSFNRARAANRRFRSLALDGGKATLKATNRTVQVFPTGTTTTRLSLKLGAGTVRRSSSGGTASRSVVVEVRLRVYRRLGAAAEDSPAGVIARCSARNSASRAGEDLAPVVEDPREVGRTNGSATSPSGGKGSW